MISAGDVGADPEVGPVEVPSEGPIVGTDETRPGMSGDVVEPGPVDGRRRRAPFGRPARRGARNDRELRGGPDALQLLREDLLRASRPVPRDTTDG